MMRGIFRGCLKGGEIGGVKAALKIYKNILSI
jgi:hypothetical protein